jgi:Golgi SNAP receptor complex protein 2
VHLAQWFATHALVRITHSSHRKQNALFNSALRQSASIRKDLDQFADTAAPSPHLQAQLNASLTTFARTVDDYAKLAKQEPVQTKQEKAFERVKTYRAELEEYRDSFKRIKSANEDVVRFDLHLLTERYYHILRGLHG